MRKAVGLIFYMDFLDFFAGIGGFRKGMELAGHKCVGFCEFDKYARASYISMHLITEEQRQKLAEMPLQQRQKESLKDEYLNGEWCSTDIRTVNASNIPRADCWCFGAPCLVAGTLITTKEGLKPIETVEIGDIVLTHSNTWEKVTERMVNIKTGIYTIKVKGSPITEITGNHRVYVRYKRKLLDNTSRSYRTEWSSPEWKAVEDFRGDEWIQFPLDKTCENPMNLTEDEAWLVGRYIADGYLRDSDRKDRPSRCRRVIFCVGKGKEAEFEEILKVGFSQEKGCRKYQTCSKRLFELCSMCGKHAIDKHIPSFVMSLPVPLLNAFIKGYMSGDGCEKDGVYKATSISRKLIYQLGQCVTKAYGCGYSIHYSKRPPKYIIEGREVNQHDTWQIVWRENEKQSVVLDGSLWQKLRKISYEKDRTETVYNLEVENEHSYTANNMGLHNCQDFSVGGKRKGLSGDRSSLVREIFRILSEIREEDKPEWLIYENVKGMLSSNRGFDFLSILLELDWGGYDIEWQVFDSSNFGVPQKRERVYTVGHLRSRGTRKIFPIYGTDTENRIRQVGHLDSDKRDNPSAYRVYKPEGLAPTLNSGGGGGRMPYILTDQGSR